MREATVEAVLRTFPILKEDSEEDSDNAILPCIVLLSWQGVPQ